MKAKAVITDWGFPSLDPEREIFASRDVEVAAFQCKTEEDVVKVTGDADVVLAQWAPITQKVIGGMRHCKGIVRYGIGLDTIDLKAAAQKGIPVRNVPDYCLDEVADHTMALILALQRQVSRVFQLVRDGVWRITPPLELPPLRKSSLGLVGLGRIARLVAQRAKPFGLQVIASDPFADAAVFTELGVKQVSQVELFGTADIVSLHCPLSESTRHTVNASTLEMMKKTGLLVNTSRGGLVETGALVKALEQGRIAGAALDVVEEEPIPRDHPILALSNIIITSHISWYSSSSVQELQRRAALTALELLNIPYS